MQVWKVMAATLCLSCTAFAADKIEMVVTNTGPGAEPQQVATDAEANGTFPVAFTATLSAALSSVREGATQTVTGPSSSFLVVVTGESKSRKASLMRVGSADAIKSWTLAHGISDAKLDEAVAEIASAAGLAEPEGRSFSEQATGDRAVRKNQRN